MTAQDTSKQPLIVIITNNIIRMIGSVLQALATIMIALGTWVGVAIVYLGRWVIEATGGGRALSLPTSGLSRVMTHLALLTAVGISVYQWVGIAAKVIAQAPLLAPHAVGLSILGGIVLAALTSIVQARFLRSDNAAHRRAKLQAVKIKRMEGAETEGLIDAGAKAAKDFNAAHIRSYRMDGVLAIGAWAAEFYAISGYLAWGDPLISMANFGSAVITLACTASVEAIIHIIEEDTLSP